MFNTCLAEGIDRGIRREFEGNSGEILGNYGNFKGIVGVGI